MWRLNVEHELVLSMLDFGCDGPSIKWTQRQWAVRRMRGFVLVDTAPTDADRADVLDMWFSIGTDDGHSSDDATPDADANIKLAARKQAAAATRKLTRNQSATARKQAAAAASAAVRKQAAAAASAEAARKQAVASAAAVARKRVCKQAAAVDMWDHSEPCITRIMATSQRTASGTTIFKGKGPHCYEEETLEYAWVKRNIKKWFLEAVVYPELGKWHKAPLGSAVSDSASAAGGASGGGGAHNSGSICEWFCR